MGPKKKLNLKGFKQKGSRFKRNEKSSKDKFFNTGPYYGCCVPCDMIEDCPLIQKNEEKLRSKLKKDNKKLIVATQSDKETSNHESDGEHVINIYLIAKELKGNKKMSMKAQMRQMSKLSMNLLKKSYIVALVNYAHLQ